VSEKAERNDAIVAAFKQGASYAEIARQFGISALRAKQIIERRGRVAAIAAEGHGLGIRARNALRNEGFAIDDWQAILARPAKEWLNVQNLGRKSYAEIVAHCHRLRDELDHPRET
jgi:DNA-directed RNA polymerase alpha subunit